MKVMWICAFAPSAIAEKEGIERNRFGGWIDGALKGLSIEPDVSIAVCYPQHNSNSLINGSVDSVRYYGIYSRKAGFDYDPDMKKGYGAAIKDFEPDVIHFWGAEFPFFYPALEAATGNVLSLCSIQGLCGVYVNHYYANLPINVIKGKTVRDILRKDGLIQQRRKYVQRGEFEKKILTSVDHVIGRTEWDNACTQQIAKQAEYHFCNETLRDIFYEKADSWEYSGCEKHSIFVSQASYPIKGFHNAIEAVHYLVDKYPDVKLYTTGISPFSVPWYRQGSYQRYLTNLIDTYNIREKVIFTGALNAEEMCDRYLRSNVFVSASSIENSPNSVGEAMLIGMPVIASYVGGTMDLLADEEEGFLYQADAPYMLAHYIDKIFEQRENAKKLGRKASQRAQVTHDPKENLKTLINIYSSIIEGEL